LVAYWLVVGKTQSGHILVLEGKLLKVLDDLGELGEDEVQSTLLEDQVGIVGNCLACQWVIQGRRGQGL
jgi:lipid-binding SYLF domain-containing protein